MPVGQPLKFQSVEELQKKIDAYFASCHNEEGEIVEPYTITGLALALDTTRKTLIEYENRPEYVNAIKRAKTKVENFAEKNLYSKHSTGAIFALKNFDWSDTTKVESRNVDKDGNDIKLISDADLNTRISGIIDKIS